MKLLSVKQRHHPVFARIDSMTHEDMFRFYRFAEPGKEEIFTNRKFFDYFMKKFNRLGGISKWLEKIEQSEMEFAKLCEEAGNQNFKEM